MKNLKQLSVVLFSLLLLTAFNRDSKLTQAGAEKAIRELVTLNNSSATGSRVYILEMPSLERLEQLSDTVATCWGKAPAKMANSASSDPNTGKDCLETELKMEFYFKKNKDNNWILWGISRSSTQVRINPDTWLQFMEPNRGLSIAVQ